MLRAKTNSATSTAPPASKPRVLGIRYFLVLWPLFLAICFGLGYPTLRRYDPRTTEGMSDVSKYYAITTGADTSSFKEMFRCRVLVPYVARPFYWFAQTYLHTWNPGFFGLLMSNALFCATTACLVVNIGNRLLNDLGVALLGATLYLLSFNISNLQLSGLIDSGEACFMAALIWSLLGGKWYLLPVWAVLGALAKETFVPFSCLFAFTWWLTGRREGRTGASEVKWIVALTVMGLATVLTVHSVVAGQFKWPWNIAGQARVPGNFFVALLRCLTEPTFWYVFGWLIPLGIWRLRYFPKPWLVASLAAATAAILLGAFIDAGGNIGRSVFNISGPLLSLSVALLIARPSVASSTPRLQERPER